MFLTLQFFSKHVTVTGVDKSTIIPTSDNFKINGEITYKSAKYSEMQGLLMNSRMVNGIFDDYNQYTVHNCDYPDANAWNATRNTVEFIGNLSTYKDIIHVHMLKCTNYSYFLHEK